MLNFFARLGAKIDKIDSLFQGEGKRAWRARVRAASTPSLTFIQAAHVADSLARLRCASPSVGMTHLENCSMVIVNETAITRHNMWLLPSP